MAGNFFKQRMSYSIQNGKEKCVLNTIIDKAIFGKIFFYFSYTINLSRVELRVFYRKSVPVSILILIRF